MNTPVINRALAKAFGAVNAAVSVSQFTVAAEMGLDTNTSVFATQNELFVSKVSNELRVRRNKAKSPVLKACYQSRIDELDQIRNILKG